MKSSTRPYSSFSTAKTQKLPELPPTRPGGKMTYDDIEEIKLKTQQMDQERRQLKSKTQRMKQVTKERNNSIKTVFSQTQEKQSLKTASRNTLKSLNETADSLERSLEAHKQELEDLKKSDKLQVSKELELEIQMYYLEHKRLNQKTSSLKENENNVSNILTRLQKQMKETKSNERAVCDLQDEINSLTEKYFAYSKSEMKLYSTKKLKELHDDPSKIEAIRKKIEEDIQNEKEEIEAAKKELELVAKKEERNTKFLHDLIDEQAQKIREKLNSSK